jgi:hypothetical protein
VEVELQHQLDAAPEEQAATAGGLLRCRDRKGQGGKEGEKKSLLVLARWDKVLREDWSKQKGK